MRLVSISRTAALTLATIAIVAVSFALPASASAGGSIPFGYCDPFTTTFCDNFAGRTWFKDETPDADWHRWTTNDPVSAAEYDIENQHVLRLGINEDATSASYVNADISTSEMFDTSPVVNYPYGENTLVETQFKFSPNMSANPYSGADFKGSGGFLLWNNSTFDIFGYSVNDPYSFPFAGLWINVVVEGQDLSIPLFDVDITQYHTYGIERLSSAVNFYIDGELVYNVAINQEGAPSLPADRNLAIDLWVDNASNVLNFETFQIDQIPNDITDPIFMDIEYFSMTEL